MSTLSLRKIKHDSSSVDNIVTNSDGGVGIGGIDPSTLPSFVHHAIKVQNGGGLGIQSDSATDNRWIFFGNGTSSGDVQRAGIVNQGSDQSLALATAGTQRLIVDASGRVTMPYQPAFYAMMNNNTFTSTQAIVFEDVYVNRGSCYNPANGRFTAPVAGTYHFSANFLKRSGAGRLLFHKNDTYYGSGNSQVYQGTTSEIPMAATIIITLAVNDYVTVIGQIDGGDVYGNANSHNGFSGFLIG